GGGVGVLSPWEGRRAGALRRLRRPLARRSPAPRTRSDQRARVADRVLIANTPRRGGDPVLPAFAPRRGGAPVLPGAQRSADRSLSPWDPGPRRRSLPRSARRSPSPSERSEPEESSGGPGPREGYRA